MLFKIILASTLFAFLSASPGRAQNQLPAKKGYPCLGGPHRSDFDFWVGDWDVYITGTDKLIGKSIITKAEGGCAILEQWKALSGNNTGNSINFYDNEAGHWVQVYAGSGGSNTTYTDGQYKDDAMRFAFAKKLPGHTGKGNLIFYRISEDEVRQYQDFAAEGSDTYTVEFDYTYKRRKK